VSGFQLREKRETVGWATPHNAANSLMANAITWAGFGHHEQISRHFFHRISATRRSDGDSESRDARIRSRAAARVPRPRGMLKQCYGEGMPQS